MTVHESDSTPEPDREEHAEEAPPRRVYSQREQPTSSQSEPAWHPTALHPERIHPAKIAAKLENLEELFAPDTGPDDIEYGVQPPG